MATMALSRYCMCSLTFVKGMLDSHAGLAENFRIRMRTVARHPEPSGKKTPARSSV